MVISAQIQVLVPMKTKITPPNSKYKKNKFGNAMLMFISVNISVTQTLSTIKIKKISLFSKSYPAGEIY